MPRRDEAPRRALGSKGPLEGHQAIHVRYRDSSPLKTISPCVILRTLEPESACRIRDAYNLTEALRIASPLQGSSLQRREALRGLLVPIDTTQRKQAVKALERLGYQVIWERGVGTRPPCLTTPPRTRAVTQLTCMEHGLRRCGVPTCREVFRGIRADLVWRQGESRPASDQYGPEAATPMPVIAPGTK
jgi:hypothetical protein